MKGPNVFWNVALALALTTLSGGWRDKSGVAASSEAAPQIAPRMNRLGLLNPYASAYQAILDRAVKQGLPGLAVCIKTPEEGAWIGADGYADLETRTKIRPDSVFYSSSHIKIYTATAVMMLWEAGLIDIEATIDHYLPVEMSGRIANAGTAKVRHLLNHTSGIPDYDLAEPWDNDPLGSTWRDDIESIYGKKAEFRPGDEFQYCNINYKLLSVIMDQVTGDHADFIRRMIFRPLGLTHTYYRLEPELPRPPHLVTPYYDRYGDGALESSGLFAPLIRRNHAYGETDLLADLGDYTRFIEALFGGELVEPEALKAMSTPSGSAVGYGYGFGVAIKRTSAVDEAKYGLGYGHGGRAPFGVIDVNHYPKIGATIGLASNYGYAKKSTPVMETYDRLSQEFAQAVFFRTPSGVVPGTAARAGGASGVKEAIRRTPR